METGIDHEQIKRFFWPLPSVIRTFQQVANGTPSEPAENRTGVQAMDQQDRSNRTHGEATGDRSFAATGVKVLATRNLFSASSCRAPKVRAMLPWDPLGRSEFCELWRVTAGLALHLRQVMSDNMGMCASSPLACLVFVRNADQERDREGDSDGDDCQCSPLRGMKANCRTRLGLGCRPPF